MLRKTTKNILWYGECSCLQHCKHLYSWWRITQTIGIPWKIQKISQWNRCSTYLRNWCPNNQMRSMEWKQLTGKTVHGSICLRLVMNKSSVFSTQVFVFYDSVLCLGKMNENPRSNIAWEERLAWFKSSLEYRTLDRIDGGPTEFEWIIFPGFTALQLSQEVQELLLRWVEHGRILQDGLSSCRCSLTSKNANQMLISFLYLQKRFGAGQWSFLGLGSENKWSSIREIVHTVNGTKWRKRWC